MERTTSSLASARPRYVTRFSGRLVQVRKPNLPQHLDPTVAPHGLGEGMAGVALR